MSDHFTTQYNHRRRALQAVRDMAYWVEHGKVSHAKYLDMLREHIYRINSYQRLTGYNKAYVAGYIEHWQSSMEFANHEWRVFHPDTGHVNARTPEGRAALEGKWSEVIGDLGANFWIGTDKVWSGDDAVFAMYDDDATDDSRQAIVDEMIEKQKQYRAKIRAEFLGCKSRHEKNI